MKLWEREEEKEDEREETKRKQRETDRGVTAFLSLRVPSLVRTYTSAAI